MGEIRRRRTRGRRERGAERATVLVRQRRSPRGDRQDSLAGSATGIVGRRRSSFTHAAARRSEKDVRRARTLKTTVRRRRRLFGQARSLRRRVARPRTPLPRRRSRPCRPRLCDARRSARAPADALASSPRPPGGRRQGRAGLLRCAQPSDREEAGHRSPSRNGRPARRRHRLLLSLRGGPQARRPRLFSRRQLDSRQLWWRPPATPSRLCELCGPPHLPLRRRRTSLLRAPRDVCPVLGPPQPHLLQTRHPRPALQALRAAPRRPPSPPLLPPRQNRHRPPRHCPPLDPLRLRLPPRRRPGPPRLGPHPRFRHPHRPPRPRRSHLPLPLRAAPRGHHRRRRQGHVLRLLHARRHPPPPALSVAHDLVVVVVVVVLRPSDRQSERAIRIMRCVLRGIFGTTTTLALQAWTTTTTTRLATRRHSTFLEQAEAWGGAYRAEVKEAALITQCAVRLCMDVEESLSVARSEAASVGTGVSTTVSGTAAVKGDSTPVTAADFGIQGFISASLQRAFPSDLFMGEEDASALRSDDALREKSHDMAARMARERGFDLDQTTFLDAVDRGRLELSPGKRVWILDPIDGTKGLVTGQEYAIGLALVVDGDPVVGVLANPNRPVVPIMVAVKGAGIRFWPYAGFGYMQDEYQPPWQRQSYDYSKLAPDAKGSWGELGSAPATPAVDYPPFLVSRPVDAASPLPFGPMAAPSELCCGALVKYFAVASGEAAAFIMFEANLKSWDHAPGVLCVLESGGTCVDARNQPIKFYDRAFAVDGAIVAFAKAADTKTRQLVTASVLDALRATSSSSSAPSD